MQELNRLKICTNFILKNSDRGEYLSDRFSVDSRRINKNQIFISLEPNVAKNITNINHAIAKGCCLMVLHVLTRREAIRTHRHWKIMLKRAIWSAQEMLRRLEGHGPSAPPTEHIPLIPTVNRVEAPCGDESKITDDLHDSEDEGGNQKVVES